MSIESVVNNNPIINDFCNEVSKCTNNRSVNCYVRAVIALEYIKIHQLTESEKITILNYLIDSTEKIDRAWVTVFEAADQCKDKALRAEFYLKCIKISKFSLTYLTKQQTNCLVKYQEDFIVEKLVSFDKTKRASLYRFIIDLDASYVLEKCGDRIYERNREVFDLLVEQLDDGSSEITDALKEKLFKNHPGSLLKVRFYVDSLDFEERIKLAQTCLQNDPEALIDNVLYLFSEDEIQKNRAVFEPIFASCVAACSPAKKSYYEKIKMYLDHIEGLTAQPATGAASSQQTLPKTPFARDGGLWECVGEKNASDGNSWIFKLRWEFDRITRRRREPSVLEQNQKHINEKDDAMFPALEITLFLFHNLFKKQILIDLGYKLEIGPSGDYITLPDGETIMNRWKELRTRPEYAHLPDLSIYFSNGVASHQEFIQAFLKYDLLLSTGIEFAHDQMFHLMRILVIMSESTEYVEVRDIARNFVVSLNQSIVAARNDGPHTIEERVLLNIMDYSVGIFVDLFLASKTMAEMKEYIEEWGNVGGSQALESVWDFKGWRKSLPKMLKVWSEADPELATVNPDDYTVEKIKSFWLKTMETGSNEVSHDPVTQAKAC